MKHSIDDLILAAHVHKIAQGLRLAACNQRDPSVSALDFFKANPTASYVPQAWASLMSVADAIDDVKGRPPTSPGS